MGLQSTEELWKICREATKHTPSLRVSQTKQSRNPHQRRTPGGSLCLTESGLEARPQKMTQHGDFQKVFSSFLFFFIHLGRFASAPKSTWPIKQHKHLFGATPAAEGPPERQRRDAGGELNLATCCAHLSEFCQCHLLTLLRIQRKNEEWSCCWRLCYYYSLFSCLVLLTSALISDPATCPPHRLPPHTCSSIQYSQVSITFLPHCLLYVSFLAPALSLIFPASVLRVHDCVLRHTYPPRSPRFCLAAFQVMTVQVAGSNSMLIANQKFWKTHFIVTECCLVDAVTVYNKGTNDILK